ncbi:MAG: hypothetical protein HOP12_15250 [Candidatus Eisenbacteria bacterium]|uniref:FlgD Ig-like domain-containing protein n=1 Tax=Eiseniibacteriota bacterium TaxID=2212470 RepID=A0A849SM37_UNCEI|nr:hypothetical protein [Candidatus Eisenbacteria bacterium]
MLPLLVLSCAVLTAAAALAHADLPEVVESDFERTSAPAPRRSSPASFLAIDPDTLFIGHVFGSTGLPGTPGGFGPYHVGRGRYRVSVSSSAPVADRNGYWDWDRFNPGESDSLQGWWPLDRGHGTSGGVTVNDRQRSFQGLDHGNLGNYVINQGSPKRTFGVIGYWHWDPGAFAPGLPDSGAAISGPGVEWFPLSGNASAWCGLRGQGDDTVEDPITHNSFNQAIVDRQSSMTPGVLTGAQSLRGTDKNYPGYGSQWDQLLYRDVQLADGDSLNLSFLYSTRMDTRAATAPATRIGWFDLDPLKAPTPGDGNFISSSDAGALAPVDSFMVYVGVPVTDAACVYSDGSVAPVADPLRRWFSEVIAIQHPRRELLSVAGEHAPASFNAVLPGGLGSFVQQLLDVDGTENGGRIRLVFRVKTNRGFDDADWGIHQNFSSQTEGAARVDDVLVNAWPEQEGNFESAESIDNTRSALLSWRSTGKPTAVFFHAHDLASLPFADPCGVASSSQRQCNLSARVITPGNHDQFEKPGGTSGTAAQDRHGLFGSPTIDLTSSAPGNFNPTGVDAAMANATGDFKVMLDLYTAGLKGSANGNYWQVAWQSYPARQANGLKVWGEVRTPPIVSSFLNTSCVTLVSRGARFDNAIVTSNASGIPDSLRFYLQHVTRCFALTISPADCSPSFGPNAGTYFDNVSLAFIDAPSAPAVALNFWDLFVDAFPTNPDDALVVAGGAAFDTCAAYVRTALNLASASGLSRPNVPADTALVSAPGAGMRVDLVFRILPGVGNYVAIGDRGSGVAQRPDANPRIAALPGDGSFWGAYLLENGAFGTGAPMNGISPGPGHAAGVWNPNVWNSARCDTAELNLFAANGNGPNLPQLTPGVWATMLHESDPHFTTLGTVKPRCFLLDPSANAPLDDTNITCGGGGFPPAWVSAPGSGWNPNEVPGQPGATREYTKIIPDGQFTPGAHVQYFYRVSSLSTPASFVMAPDTNVILPQLAESSTDGHRWQQFGVLPDRWKDPAYGGVGMACMLYVDFADRRGDEREWVAAMDSIGGTLPARRGAHNGWSARGDQNPFLGVNAANGGDPTLAVAAHGGQPGTLWDLYNVRAVESGVTAGSFASRLAANGAGALSGRTATHGPTPAMLRYFYRMLVMNTGDLGVGGRSTLGPIANRTDDDVALLQDFASQPDGTSLPRTVIALGRSLAESQANPATGHPGFLETYFGASLRSGSYRSLTATQKELTDLVPSNPIDDGLDTHFAGRTDCNVDPDVLVIAAGATSAQVALEYSDPSAIGASPPFIAGVYVPPSIGHPHQSILEAVRLEDVGAPVNRARIGRSLLVLTTLSQVLQQIGCGALTMPVGVGESPTSSTPIGYLLARSANPSREPGARLAFSLPRAERAQLAIFDAAGRRVRLLADRWFPAGREQRLDWDGKNDSGQMLSPGVYFWRLLSPSFQSRRKLTFLR